MSEKNENYLKHIRDECIYIQSVLKNKALSKKKFLEDETLKRAFLRSLEIIGEAIKNLDLDFKVKHDTISWRSMAGMRDRLIHNYTGVNYNLVWDTVSNKIPELSKKIITIIEKEQR